MQLQKLLARVSHVWVFLMMAGMLLSVVTLIARSSASGTEMLYLPIVTNGGEPPSEPPGVAFVRGFMVTSINSESTTASNMVEIYLPDITVYLSHLQSGEEVARVRTDLSGRFSIPKQQPGRYQLCWEADGFTPGCYDGVISIQNKHLHLGPIQIQIPRSNSGAPIYGEVRLGDNSLPRTLEAFANVNAFAQVSVSDSDGNQIDQVYVNNFGDYLIPDVPAGQALMLQASIEDSKSDRTIAKEVLVPSLPHRTDIRLANQRPRFEPVVASINGQPVTTANPGATVQLTAEAEDPDGDRLSYRWIVPGEGGTLSSLSGSSVDWQLPNSAAIHSVEVLAYDDKGGYAKSRVSVSTGQGVLFSGKILNQGGTALADAQIDINSKIITSNNNGFFRLHLDEAENYVMNVRKEGYGLLSRVYLKGITSGRWTLTPATVVNVDPTQDINVTDARENSRCPGPLSNTINWETYPNQRQPRYQDGDRHLIRVGQFGFTFDELPLQSTYAVGQTFMEGDLSATGKSFVFSDGTVTERGNALVGDSGQAGGSGREMLLNNINLSFDFGRSLDGLTLLYGAFGGNLNIEVNGDFQNLTSFDAINGQTIGGVQVQIEDLGNRRAKLRLFGRIDSFVIGGQEFVIDNLFEPLPSVPRGRQCGPGMQLFIPANSLVDSDGNPPPGNVDVAVSTFDILSPDGMPGDYSALDSNGQMRVMESFGAGSISISANGQTFNLEEGAQATLTMPVDPIHFEFSRPIPPTIPNLLYNPSNGIWDEIGEWKLVGNEYVTKVDHFSEFNTDLIKEDQACVRIFSEQLPAQYRLEVTIPQGPGAAPKVVSGNVDNSDPWHVVYNLPTDTNIVLVVIRQNEDIPIGTFVVNTGGPQNPTNPNRPAYPYNACQSDVELYDPELSDPPSAGSSPHDTFLNGLYSFVATNIDEYAPANPGDPTPEQLAQTLSDTTNDYYDQIDPHGLRETLAEFQSFNNFNEVDEVHAVFGNSGDLGFGRDMHCMRNEVNPGEYDVACYVTNYGDFFTPDETDFEQAANQDTPIATVTMEYSRVEDPNDVNLFVSDERIVKFYVYSGDGTRINSADLDGFGQRPVPQLCMVCHGGSANYDGSPSDTNPPLFNNFDDVNLGSVFLPFDLHGFTIVDGLTVDGELGKYDKANQQDEFRQLNEEIVLSTSPGPVIEEIIAHMYPGAGDQVEDFVVDGWEGDAAHEAMYQNVITPACRACHAAQLDTNITFQTSQQAIDYGGSIRFRVCDQGTMPHARATYDRFWTSIAPHQPSQLIAWGEVFVPASDWSTCATAAPLNPPPPPDIVYHDPDVQQIWTNNCSFCHTGAGGGLPGSLDLTDGNAYGEIVNQPADQPAPTIDLIEPNNLNQSYLWHKLQDTQGSVGGSGDQMPLGGSLSSDELQIIQNWIEGGAPESP